MTTVRELIEMSDRIMGVFKYDLFPHMIVHEITGWSDDGDAVCKELGTFKSESLLGVFPARQGLVIRDQLNTIQQKYHKKLDELKSDALKDLFETFPTLQNRKDNAQS